ncbi:MAG: wax ester/triacylglycerol synthase family O-acyltransferase [Pseudomonadales bacterium]
MQQLSGQDASFLYFETPTSPMHIGGIMIYDPSTVKGGKQGFKDILRAIESRLHLARSFREKVVNVPFNLDHPWWVEDKHFDLEYHVRHIRLPEPGDWRQLCIQVARLHSRPLDLTRPLWEFTVVEGLDSIPGLPKGSYAIVSKVHHACIDGMSGVDLIEAIHDLEPAPAEVPKSRPWHGENDPNPAELLFRAQINNMTQPFRFAEVMARTVPALGRLGQLFADRKMEPPRVQPPRTRFNHQVSAHRVVEGRRFELSAIRAIKNAVPGATVNDVVLTLVGGALRQYLAEKQELPDESMIAMAPISVRGAEGKNAMGNQVAAMTVALGTEIADPLERLKSVHESAMTSKAMTNAVGAKLMTDYSQFIPSTTAALAARLYTEYGLAERMSVPFNCVVTNVPGPQVPLYCAGARLVAQFGLGPIFDGMGLIFPVFSYCGWVMISLTSCREMLPDPGFFGECLDQSFESLMDATGVVVPEAASGA